MFKKNDNLAFRARYLIMGKSILVAIWLLASQTSLANSSQNYVTDAVRKANQLIRALALPVHVELRRAKCIRNSLIDHQAPPLAVNKWLCNPKVSSAWPAGKFTILYFWNAGCGACTHMIGEVCKLASEVISKGCIFISVHPHMSDSSELEEFLKDNGVDFYVCVDSHASQSFWNSKTFESYGTAVVPQFVIIGADGRILSFKHPKDWDWKRLGEEPTEIKADSIREARPLTVIPERWIADELDSESSVAQSFFLYRPDTPELSIRMLKGSDPNVVVTYNKHSDFGQTVFALYGNAMAPVWGKALKGTIHIEVEYGDKSDTLEIPFTIASKPLLAYNPSVYLGIVEKGKEIVKRIIFRTYVPRESLRIKVIHVPSGVTVQLPESLGIGCGEIPIKLCFRGSETGTQRGIVKLKALYNQQERSEQLVELKYTAIVRD